MDYFLVNKRPSFDSSYCFLRNAPEGTEDLTYRMAEGYPMGADYPEDARVYMDGKHKGTRLPSLIGNTKSFLILANALKGVVEGMNTGPVEYLPFDLYDHKKRLASKDYFIVNPLGAVDCLNLKASEIEYFEGDVVGIDRYVLDPAKLEGAPDLFRVRETPREYVMSGRLVAALQALNPTNIYLTKLDQAASPEEGARW